MYTVTVRDVQLLIAFGMNHTTTAVGGGATIVVVVTILVM